MQQQSQSLYLISSYNRITVELKYATRYLSNQGTSTYNRITVELKLLVGNCML